MFGNNINFHLIVSLSLFRQGTSSQRAGNLETLHWFRWTQIIEIDMNFDVIIPRYLTGIAVYWILVSTNMNLTIHYVFVLYYPYIVLGKCIFKWSLISASVHSKLFFSFTGRCVSQQVVLFAVDRVFWSWTYKGIKRFISQKNFYN